MKAHSGEKPNNDVLGWEDILMLDDDANAEVEFTKGLMAGAFFSGWFMKRTVNWEMVGEMAAANVMSWHFSSFITSPFSSENYWAAGWLDRTAQTLSNDYSLPKLNDVSEENQFKSKLVSQPIGKTQSTIDYMFVSKHQRQRGLIEYWTITAVSTSSPYKVIIESFKAI